MVDHFFRKGMSEQKTEQMLCFITLSALHIMKIELHCKLCCKLHRVETIAMLYDCLVTFGDWLIQSINQFYFLLSITSSMPLALYNGTHTL